MSDPPSKKSVPPASRREPKSRPGGLDRESVPFLLLRTSTPPPALRTAKTARQRLLAGAPAATPPLAGVDWANPGALGRTLGAGGLLVAALLVLVAIFADFLASDLPIACDVEGAVFVLPNVTRPPGLVRLTPGERASKTRWAISPLVRYGPRAEMSPSEISPLARPSGAHPFGTDREGRDVFARAIHGTRSYLVFALAAVLASVALGGVLGAAAGLFGGTIDALVSRAVESVSAFPPLVLVLGIQAAVPHPSLLTLFSAIALTRWPEIARLVRGEVMLAATRDYVLAARALGASPLRVLRRHIEPNVRAPLVVTTAIGVGAVVLTEASLDFLRVGTPAGVASWGETMSEFRDAPFAWWLLAFPGALLVLTIVAYNVMGEAIRAELDPRSS